MISLGYKNSQIIPTQELSVKLSLPINTNELAFCSVHIQKSLLLVIKPSVLKSFLGAVAEHVLDNHGPGIQDCHFIFPNRRAVQVFKNQLIQLAKMPLWTPAMSSVDDWL